MSMTLDAQSITQRINGSESISVNQPPLLEMRLSQTDEQLNLQSGNADKNRKKGVHAGYRVLVFSDNNSRTAKNQANSIAHRVSGGFPEHNTYVVYNSPYWRMKLGDFIDREDAEKVANSLRSKYPDLAPEVRVIRDRVTIK